MARFYRDLVGPAYGSSPIHEVQDVKHVEDAFRGVP